jgi:hypothetical protein
MAYKKNKQTPSRTLRYYHVQDYLLRPSCSIRRRVRRRPFLLEGNCRKSRRTLLLFDVLTKQKKKRRRDFCDKKKNSVLYRYDRTIFLRHRKGGGDVRGYRTTQSIGRRYSKTTQFCFQMGGQSLWSPGYGGFFTCSTHIDMRCVCSRIVKLHKPFFAKPGAYVETAGELGDN